MNTGFGILTAAFMKSSIICDITPCNPVKVNRPSGGKYPLHLQGRRISQYTSIKEAEDKLLLQNDG
jgi:hypothetical protein